MRLGGFPYEWPSRSVAASEGVLYCSKYKYLCCLTCPLWAIAAQQLFGALSNLSEACR